jgi:hypothetical protein
MRRVSATCCSYSSIMVVPDDPRACMPVLRDNQSHAAMSKMNGNHETTNDAQSFMSNAPRLILYQETLDGFSGSPGERSDMRERRMPRISLRSSGLCQLRTYRTFRSGRDLERPSSITV